MPFSAYLKAGLFVVAAAAALFATAGTIAIPGFWAYLAIFAVVMIVSFATLDPDLLRERMRPGGKKPPLSLRIFSLVLFMHWIVAGLDRGRFHWSDDVPGWLQGVCLFTVAAGYEARSSLPADDNLPRRVFAWVVRQTVTRKNLWAVFSVKSLVLGKLVIPESCK